MPFQPGHKLLLGRKTGRIPDSAFPKGHVPWNKGKQYLKMLGNTNGFKKGQIPWNKGKKLPYVSERNRTNNPQGKSEKSYQWTGGSHGWKKKQALIRDNYTCQMCGFSERDIMQVDHIKPKCIFKDIALEMSNLMTLCPNCHARKTIREKKQKLYFNPGNSWTTHT